MHTDDKGVSIMETMRKSNKGKRRKLRILKRKLVIFTMITLFTMIGCLHFGKLSTDAHGNLEEDPVSFKYYKSIEIEEGDTLWGIAEEYMSDEYDSVQEYIAELKEINQLVTDDIQSANYLTVVYYDSEFKE